MVKTGKLVKESLLSLFFPLYSSLLLVRKLCGAPLEVKQAFSYFTAAKVYFSDSTNANDVYIFLAPRYRRKHEKKSY